MVLRAVRRPPRAAVPRAARRTPRGVLRAGSARPGRLRPGHGGRNAYRDRRGVDLDLQLANRFPFAAVQLVGERPVEPDLDPLSAGDPDELRLGRLAGDDPAEHPGPVGRVPGRDHAELEQPAVGFRTTEDLKA